MARKCWVLFETAQVEKTEEEEKMREKISDGTIEKTAILSFFLLLFLFSRTGGKDRECATDSWRLPRTPSEKRCLTTRYTIFESVPTASTLWKRKKNRLFLGRQWKKNENYWADMNLGFARIETSKHRINRVMVTQMFFEYKNIEDLKSSDLPRTLSHQGRILMFWSRKWRKKQQDDDEMAF